MSDRELRFNIYDRGKIGHANVSFYQDGKHQFTIGANVLSESPKLALPQVLPSDIDDGIKRDESAYHLGSVSEGTVKSQGVPVTDAQYDDLLEEALSLENQTFNYSVLTEACIELVAEFYDATGHPGQFGDLFAQNQRTTSLVWSRVPESDDSPITTRPDDEPFYTPPEPIMPDPPSLPEPTIFGALPDPPTPKDESFEPSPSQSLSPAENVHAKLDGQRSQTPVSQGPAQSSNLDEDPNSTSARELQASNPEVAVSSDVQSEIHSEDGGSDIHPHALAGHQGPMDQNQERPDQSSGSDRASDFDGPQSGGEKEITSKSDQTDTTLDGSIDKAPVHGYDLGSPVGSGKKTELNVAFDVSEDVFDFRLSDPTPHQSFDERVDLSFSMDIASVADRDAEFSFDAENQDDSKWGGFESLFDGFELWF